MTAETMTADEAPGGPENPRTPSSPSASSAVFHLRYAVGLGLILICGAVASTLTLHALLAHDLGNYTQSVVAVAGVRRLVLGASALSGLIHLALTGLLVAGLALVGSNKIAGPIFRLERILHDAAKGRLPPPVWFRANDRTGRLATSFNQLSQRLAERHAKRRADLRALDSAQRELRSSIEQDRADEEILAAARELRERADALARGLDRLGGGEGAGRG